jgi:hypothetical protein
MAKHTKQESPGYTYLTLKPLDVHALPPHPELDHAQDNGPTLRTFIRNLLDDRREINATGTYKAKGTKDYGIQYPEVRLYVKKVGKENWASRTSVHNPNHAARASFNDFQEALKKDHSKHERLFTDTIFDCNQLLAWSAEELDKAADGLAFTDLTMEVNEIYHSLPWPFNDRVFTVLVLTARQIGKEQFYIIEVPVKPGLPLQSSERKSHFVERCGISRYDSQHPTGDQKRKQGKRLVHGVYCSVNRVTEVEHLPYYRIQPGDSKPVRWQMATASDAKGLIPMWIQKIEVPKKIAKDVPYFLDWIRRWHHWRQAQV